MWFDVLTTDTSHTSQDKRKKTKNSTVFHGKVVPPNVQKISWGGTCM
jgi:hypothetical protein